MEAMRSTWTDSRLDDLAKRMDEGFVRIDGELRELRTEVGALRADVGSLRAEFQAELQTMARRTEITGLRNELKGDIGELRAELKGDIGELRGDFAALNRTLIQISWGGLGAFAVGFAGVIATLIAS